MLSTHSCILLPKSNWSLLLSYGPAGLSVPARGGLVDERTGYEQYEHCAPAKREGSGLNHLPDSDKQGTEGGAERHKSGGKCE